MSTARQLPDVSLSPRWRINPFTLHTHAHGRTNTRTDTDVHTFSHSPAFSPSLSRLSLCLFLLHSFPFAPSASSSGCLHRREKGGKARFAIAGSPPFFCHFLSLSLSALSFSPAAILQARFPADAPGHTAIAEGRGFAHDSPPAPPASLVWSTGRGHFARLGAGQMTHTARYPSAGGLFHLLATGPSAEMFYSFIFVFRRSK